MCWCAVKKLLSESELAIHAYVSGFPILGFPIVILCIVLFPAVIAVIDSWHDFHLAWLTADMIDSWHDCQLAWL